MADLPPRSQRFLWHERLHEDDRHDIAWPEDLRGESAHGGKVRLEDSEHRLLTAASPRRRTARRGIRERSDRSIREPSTRIPREGSLVDGWGRSHRLFS